MGGCLVWSIQFSPQRFQGKEHWLPILSAPVLVEVDFAVLRSQLSSFVLIFIWISTETTWLRVTSIVFCTSCQSDTYRGLCIIENIEVLIIQINWLLELPHIHFLGGLLHIMSRQGV